MENRLSDVHTIAKELIRRGEIGGGSTEVEGPRVVHVERHLPARGTAVTPTSVPSGLAEEIRRMNAHMEAIRRSVEFTEAHVAIKQTMLNGSERQIDGMAVERNGWLMPLLLVANIVLLALLSAELRNDSIGRTGSAIYQKIFGLAGGKA